MRCIAFTISLFTLLLWGPSANAQPAQTAPVPPQQMTEEEIREQYAKSMNFMLRRAKLVRTLAAEHLVYIAENATDPELHIVEEASQVVAYDLVCENGQFDPVALDQMTTESTYRIAISAGKSPIAGTLTELGQRQTIPERMSLLGDLASTVFMFQVGRRRGLFDSLITDFGMDKFCSGMRTNMRQRYDSLVASAQERTSPE